MASEGRSPQLPLLVQAETLLVAAATLFDNSAVYEALSQLPLQPRRPTLSSSKVLSTVTGSPYVLPVVQLELPNGATS